MRRITRWTLLASAGLAVFAPAAGATDGHLLHGVGAINSAMGGAGVATFKSLLGTYYLNPAGLMAFDGTRMEFGFEMFKPDRSLSSAIPGFGSGTTASKSDWSPIPAMGFATRLKNDKIVVGISALGIGGFGVDYPSSTTNPILTPQPNGFGAVFSNYQYLKIAPAVAVALTPKLWLGAAVNVDWASLAVSPMPVAAPAVDPYGVMYYSGAASSDGAFGAGFQVGAVYRPNDLLSVGGSYSSKQYFQEFQFNSTWANPNLPNVGTPRQIDFRLDGPAVLAGGVALAPLPRLTLAGDLRYVFYENTTGFNDEGFNADGSMKGFGWKNVTVIAAGAEYWATERIAVRGGYNRSTNPIDSDCAFYNVAAPAIVRDHYTAGVSVRPSRRFEVSAAYYIAPERKLTGAILNPSLPAGSTLTSSLKESALLVQFSFWTR